MPELAPRLPSNNPGTEPTYAPISWTAVAALTVAIGYVLVTLMFAVSALTKKQSLIEPWLLLLPALAVVLAFVARRQIHSSEGTRTGEKYANMGWWIAILGGLGYIAYLGGVEYAVKSDANREFASWTNSLKSLDPTNPQDPNFFAATYMMIPPGARTAVKGTQDVQGIESTFRDIVLGFRSSDVVRICSRNPGAVDFKVKGLRDWDQKTTQISCTLSATLITPEGDFNLVVPMRADVNDKKQRAWQIVPSGDGFIKEGRNLTPYGWQLDYIEYTGKTFAFQFMNTLGKEGGQLVAYHGFILPGTSPIESQKMYQEIASTVQPRAAAMGVISGIMPEPAGAMTQLHTQIFAKPDGKPPEGLDLEKFKFCWKTPQHIVPPGTSLKSNPDTNSVLRIDGSKVELVVPVEFITSNEGQQPPTARGKIVLGLPKDAEAALLADLAKRKESAATAPKTDRYPEEFKEAKLPPWRITRIISDLKPVAVEQPTREGPGSPPGAH